MVKERNINLDIIRGIAAYSVVANHVLSHFSGYGESMLGNINFSLQNPLFMMVSGWALMFSKPIVDRTSLFVFLKKRTVLLILPWVIWSLLKYLILGKGKESCIDYFSYNLYHMEGLYWFLLSLWVMNVIYAISCLAYKKIVDRRIGYCIGVSLLSLLVIGFVFVVSYFTVGIDFLGTKFTTYYFPFFLLGWIGSELYKKSWSDSQLKCFDWFICFSIVLYAILISRFEIISLPDSWAILRLLVSTFGCLVIFYTIFKSTFNPANRIVKILSWGGVKTLEIYVVHYIVLGFLKTSGVSVLTVLGFSEFIINFICVMCITTLFIVIIDTNRYSRKYLFGKIK